MSMTKGQIHDKGAMLLRSHIGTAEGPDGEKFEMSLINGHIPAVKDLGTGKTFSLGWSDIIRLAVEAGVSK